MRHQSRWCRKGSHGGRWGELKSGKRYEGGHGACEVVTNLITKLVK